MERLIKLALISICLFCASVISAQNVFWQAKPQWDAVEVIGDGLIRVTKLNLQGVIDSTGQELVPCVFHRVTNIEENRFLVLDINNKIISMWDDSGNRISFNGDYYVDGAWPYFSGGLLVVRDKKGWGYMNKSGTVVIKCKYSAAFPFLHGQASVCYSDGYWAHLSADGKPVLIQSQKLRTKRLSFASSFAIFEGKPVSLVYVDNSFYMIDSFGEVISNELISQDGYLLYGGISGPQVASGSFSVTFNDIREPVSLSNDSKSVSFGVKTMPTAIEPHSIQGVTVSKDNSISVHDDLLISSQFSSVIPVSLSRILVKKDNKWGLLGIDITSSGPVISSTTDFESFRIDHASAIQERFKLSSFSSNVTVYTEDMSGGIAIKQQIDQDNPFFEVPLSYNNGNLLAKIGLIVDGIVLAPKEYSYKPSGFNNAFTVSCPSSTTVSESGKGSVRLTITNSSSTQTTAPLSIRVNGRDEKKSVVLKPRESVSFSVSFTVHLGDGDEARKSMEVRIQEDGCPDVKITKSINCIRQLKTD